MPLFKNHVRYERCKQNFWTICVVLHSENSVYFVAWWGEQTINTFFLEFTNFFVYRLLLSRLGWHKQKVSWFFSVRNFLYIWMLSWMTFLNTIFMIFLFSGIHVQAFARNKRIIQLNVTLLEPIGSDYDIIIKSVEDASNETSHCFVIHHCAVHGIPQV